MPEGFPKFPGADLADAVHVAGPGFRGAGGGLMNPGAVPWFDGVLALGKATACHWMEANGERRHLYMQGVPTLMNLDRALQLQRAEPVQLGPDFPTERKAFEDFRMYRRAGRVWVHGVMAELEVSPERITYWRTSQWHAELDVERRVLTGFTSPQLDFAPTPTEKNWCYFAHGEHLYMLYSVSPFVLLRSVGDLRFQTVIRRELAASVHDLGGFTARLSLSTNPVPYGSDHLLLLVHKFQMVEGQRVYFHWAMLLSRETLLPAKISSVPLFVGGRARGILPGIVYVMAAFEMEDDIVFSLCESDSHASFLRVPRRVIDGYWTDVPA